MNIKITKWFPKPGHEVTSTCLVRAKMKGEHVTFALDHDTDTNLHARIVANTLTIRPAHNCARSNSITVHAKVDGEIVASKTIPVSIRKGNDKENVEKNEGSGRRVGGSSRAAKAALGCALGLGLPALGIGGYFIVKSAFFSPKTLSVDLSDIPVRFYTDDTGVDYKIIAKLNGGVVKLASLTCNNHDPDLISCKIINDKEGIVHVEPTKQGKTGTARITFTVYDISGNKGEDTVPILVETRGDQPSSSSGTLIINASEIPTYIDPNEEGTKSFSISALTPDGLDYPLTDAGVNVNVSSTDSNKIEASWDASLGKVNITKKSGVTSGYAGIWIKVINDDATYAGGAAVGITIQGGIEPEPVKQTLIVDASQVPTTVKPGEQASNCPISAKYPSGSTLDAPVIKSVVATPNILENITISGSKISFKAKADAVGNCNLYIEVSDKEDNTGNFGAAIVNIKTSSDDTTSIIKKTYDELLSMVGSNLLTPGQQYQLTDYEPVINVNYNDTAKVSSALKFDIVLTASKVNAFSENVTIARNDNTPDATFVESWNVKYSFINNPLRFDWANTSGKGVIYYMKDEFNNECPYDFKNIQFKEYGGTSWLWTFSLLSSGSYIDASKTGNAYNNKILTCASNPILGKPIKLNGITMQDVSPSMKGIYGNTFGINSHDISLGIGCNENTIGADCYNIRLTTSSSNNKIEDKCHDVNGTFCSGAKIDYGCYNINLIGTGTTSTTENSNNIIGQLSHDIDMACATNNTLGTDCYNIKFGNGCTHNNIGNGCRDINFAVNASGEKYSSTNTYIENNTFGPGCSYIDVVFSTTTSGYNFKDNTFYSTKGESSDHLSFDQTYYGSWDSSVVGSGYCNHSWSNNCEITTATINIEYANLKYLFDKGHLVPGQQYRITDYQTTTTQTNTQALTHKFDIILTAKSSEAFDENARVIQNATDNYFDQARLGEWEIKYDIKNDANTYAWADTTNGKGVIYYMKDENENVAPYDFKNIQFHPIKSDWQYDTSKWAYTFNNGSADASMSANTTNVHNNVILSYKDKNNGSKLTLNNIVFDGTENNKNEFNNNCSDMYFKSNCCDNKFSSECFGNVFSESIISNDFGGLFMYNIVVKPTGSTAIFANNTFGNNCSGNTLTIDKYIMSNTFGDATSSISISKIEFTNNNVSETISAIFDDISFPRGISGKTIINGKVQ